MNFSISSNPKYIINNKEYRCQKCLLIPFIDIFTKENKLFMTTKCTNNHSYSKPFDEMLKNTTKNPISNYFCFLCEKEKKISKIYYYCSNCYLFYCFEHGEIHKFKEGHEIFLSKSFDNKCFEHNGNSVVGYCKNHNKNYCVRCEHFKENNKKIDEELSKDKINYFENAMKKNEKIIKEIELMFNDYEKLFQKLKNNFYSFKHNINKKIQFMYDIINFYKKKKDESEINYQMKFNIKNNFFDLNLFKEKINKKFNHNTNEIKELITILNINEIDNEIKENENKFKNFKFENMKNIKILNKNKGTIWCLKTLDDGRLAAGDEYSNLIIYNKQTFNTDIIINNNLGELLNFTQLKNKNIACSFWNDYTLKIIKIKNNNKYENIQIIKNAHNDYITKIIELNNENLITFSFDCSFKIWKLNNNKYEKIFKFKDSNELSDGIEIKNNEIILYALNTNPQSLVFYNLIKNKKIKTLNNLKLCVSNLCRITKINENEVEMKKFI